MFCLIPLYGYTYTRIKMVCGMNCKGIIIFLVLSYQPKMNRLMVCGEHKDLTFL